MRIFYLSKKETLSELKNQNDTFASSKIKRLYQDNVNVEKEFEILNNITYLYFNEDTEYKLLYDALANKKTFGMNTVDSKKIFDEYLSFNEKIFITLVEEHKLCKDDLIIVNDANLFLLSDLNIKHNVNCKVAFRNVEFDSFFIYRLPYYEKIIEATRREHTEIFFKTREDLKNFTEYIKRDRKYGEAFNCNYIEKYVHRKKMLNILKDENELILNIDKENKNNSNSLKYDALLVDTKCLLDVEMLLSKEISQVLAIIRIGIDLDVNTDRLIQFYQKMYPHINIIVISNIDQLINLMHMNILYIGDEMKEYAMSCGVSVHNMKYNLNDRAYDLSSINITNYSTYAKNFEDTYVLNEFEYLTLFLSLNNCLIKISEEQLEEYKKKYNAIQKRINEILCRGIFIYEDYDEMDHLNIFTNTNQKAVYRKYIEPTKITNKIVKDMHGINKFLLDYDGTLSNIQPNPWMAEPSEELKKFLLEHADKIILCTGRSKDVIDQWFSKGIEIYGEHGALHRNRNGVWEIPSYVDQKYIDKLSKHLNKDTNNDNNTNILSTKKLDENNLIDENVVDVLTYYHKRMHKSVLEKKSCGYAFHYKQVDLKSQSVLVNHLYKDLAKLEDVYAYLLTKGKGVLEVKLASKGNVVKEVNPLLVAGDDVTDEEMFLACSPHCYTVKVGFEETRASKILRRNSG